MVRRMSRDCANEGANSQAWIRFAVGDHFGSWAPTWKLWPDQQDPLRFHIGSRCVTGHYSFAKIDNGQWRRHFTPMLQGNASRGAIPSVRVVFPATGLEPARHGLVELMRVHTDPSAVCEPALRGRYRYVVKVPVHAGQANEIGVFALDRGTSRGTWPTQALGGTILLSSVELAPELRILVVYRSVLPTDVVAPIELARRSFWGKRPLGPPISA